MSSGGVLFIDRYDNQSVIIKDEKGHSIKVQVVGTTSTGAIRLAFKGDLELKVIKEEVIKHLKEPYTQPLNNENKRFPSD